MFLILLLEVFRNYNKNTLSWWSWHYNTWQCLMEVVLEFLLKTIRIIKYLKEWRKILMSFIKTLPLNRLPIFQVIFYSNWRILFLSLNVGAATEVNKSIKSDIFSCKVNCSGNRIVLFALSCVVFKNECKLHIRCSSLNESSSYSPVFLWQRSAIKEHKKGKGPCLY